MLITLKICAVSGHSEIGRNTTAVKVDDEVVILDMGLHLPNYIKYTEEGMEEVVKASNNALRKVNAIPNDKIIKDRLEKKLKPLKLKEIKIEGNFLIHEESEIPLRRIKEVKERGKIIWRRSITKN